MEESGVGSTQTVVVQSPDPTPSRGKGVVGRPFPSSTTSRVGVLPGPPCTTLVSEWWVTRPSVGPSVFRSLVSAAESVPPTVGGGPLRGSTTDRLGPRRGPCETGAEGRSDGPSEEGPLDQPSR